MEWGLVSDTSACYHSPRPKESVAPRAKAGAILGLGGYPLSSLSPSHHVVPSPYVNYFLPLLTMRRRRRWMTTEGKNFALDNLELSGAAGLGQGHRR